MANSDLIKDGKQREHIALLLCPLILHIHPHLHTLIPHSVMGLAQAGELQSSDGL